MTMFVHNPMVDMWPEGVVTREDGIKFCQLLCGKKAKIYDYRDRLPFESNDSWLFFIRGGCKEGTPLFALKHCIPAINQEVEQYAINKVGNNHNPEMAFIVGKNLATSYYYSVQLAKSRCNCRVDFGGEGSNTKKQIPRDCSRLDNGRIYEERLLEILEKNDAAMRAKNPNSPKPAYLSKAFHALLNTYDLARGHAIEAHQDVSKNYSYIDPISSMSWGRTGVLVLSPSPKNKHAGQSRLIVQQDGDVNVMCGKFQENFFHAVPHVKTWRVLLDQFKDQLDDWEKRAMEEEILLWEQGIDQNTLFRWNNTLRWFHKHDITCTFAMVPSDRQKVTLRPCPPPPHAFLSVTSSGEAASSATSSGGAAAGSSSLSTMATSVGTLPVVKPCPAPQTAPPQTKRA